MTLNPTPLGNLRSRLASGDLDPREAAKAALAAANSNPGKNVYLALDPQRVLDEAAALPTRFADPASRPPLYGMPISLKDCFDLADSPTSCGSLFYAEHNGLAATGSWVAQRLQSQGGVLIGKTHLHQLAYGITGENRDYGDCLQPADPSLLTGGSSSGAAASLQEGSAVAAIGTDTGGSIRVPAALCGLCGYRSSVGLGDWSGAAHLAVSFDTLGWLFHDLRDAPLLAHALLDVAMQAHSPDRPLRIGAVGEAFLHDAEPEVLSAYFAFQRGLRATGIFVETFDTQAWADSFEIFAPLQASEAAVVHAGNFAHFEPAIRERLQWGAAQQPEQLRELRERHRQFRDRFDQLFASYDFLVLPCSPVSALRAGQDHTAARQTILRYTTPASLAGTPTVAIPLNYGGVQLVGRHGQDASLVAFAAYLGGLGGQLRGELQIGGHPAARREDFYSRFESQC